MESPEVEAFLLKHQGFIQKHRELLTEGIENSQPNVAGLGTPIITKVQLDDDLMIAFNDAGGHPQSQLIILQLQSNRRLSQILEALHGGPPKDEPEIQVEPKEGDADESA